MGSLGDRDDPRVDCTDRTVDSEHHAHGCVVALVDDYSRDWHGGRGLQSASVVLDDERMISMVSKTCDRLANALASSLIACIVILIANAGNSNSVLICGVVAAMAALSVIFKVLSCLLDW